MVAVNPEYSGGEDLGRGPVDPSFVSGGLPDLGDRRNDESFGFNPVDAGVDYSTPPYMAPSSVQRGYTPTARVESIEVASTGAAGLCEVISKANKARIELTGLFKNFLSKTFKGRMLNIDFGKLSFSLVNGERGQFIRVEGLEDYLVPEEGDSVQFFSLCLTEGLRPTQRDDRFDIEIPVSDFDENPALAASRSQEVTKVQPLRALNPRAVAAGVQDRIAGVVSGEDGGHGRDFYGDRNDESIGFERPAEGTNG